MAGHGRARHIKRLASPKVLPIPKRTSRYLLKPSAGRHGRLRSMPLLVLLREVLHLAADKREAKRFLTRGDVLVDGIGRKDPAFPLGLMDVVSIPKLGVHYRIVVNTSGKLVPVEIGDAESKAKLCRVEGKKIVRRGRVQLAFHDGRSLLIEKEEDRFALGDTVKIAIPKQKIDGFFKLEGGARCYVYIGKHAGAVAELAELDAKGGTEAKAKLKHGDVEFLTRKNFLFAVDNSFSVEGTHGGGKK